MITREDAAAAAQRAALAAVASQTWAFKAEDLAEFCARHPAAPAEALYLHAMSSVGHRRPLPWLQTHAATRISFLVFFAAWAALEPPVKRREAAEAERIKAETPRKEQVGHLFKKSMRKQKRMADRVTYTKAQPSPAKPDNKSAPRGTLILAQRQAPAEASSNEPARLAQSAISAASKGKGKTRR